MRLEGATELLTTFQPPSRGAQLQAHNCRPGETGGKWPSIANVLGVRVIRAKHRQQTGTHEHFELGEELVRSTHARV
jgi:hypothetical protein